LDFFASRLDWTRKDGRGRNESKQTDENFFHLIFPRVKFSASKRLFLGRHFQNRTKTNVRLDVIKPVRDEKQQATPGTSPAQLGSRACDPGF
jgi:hypothetical protein